MNRCFDAHWVTLNERLPSESVLLTRTRFPSETEWQQPASNQAPLVNCVRPFADSKSAPGEIIGAVFGETKLASALSPGALSGRCHRLSGLTISCHQTESYGLSQVEFAKTMGRAEGIRPVRF